MSNPLFALVALLINSVGEAVRRLHDVLSALGIGNISGDENENAKYGPATLDAVKELQRRFQVAPPRAGELDAETAEKVNNTLFEQGRFNRIVGRVTDQHGQPFAGAIVRVTDADNLGGAFCAETTTGPGGDYCAYYDPTYYTGPWPEVNTRKEVVEPIVSAHENGIELGRSSRAAPRRELQIDLQVERRTVPEDGGVRVRGTVFDGRGTPLRDIRVEVFDRDIGKNLDSIGESTSGPEGGFDIRYTTKKFADGDAARPLSVTADLVFKLSKDGVNVAKFDVIRLPVGLDGPITVEFAVPEEEKLLLGIVARPDELVRIVAHGIRAPRGQSEYERLIEELRPLTSHRALAEFDEAGTRDVSFAAREIGEPVERISDLVWAHQMTATLFSGCSTEALYGLARRLGARDARALAARRVGDITAGIDDAVATLTIPELGDDLAGIATTIHEAAIKLVLDTVPAGASGSFGSVLASVLHEQRDREKLLAMAANHTGTGTQFWDAYRAGNPEVPVDAVQYVVQLGALTSNNAPLVAALRAAAPEAKSLRTLALTLDRAKLEQLVAVSGGVPPRGDEAADEAQTRYVRELNGLLEAAHPTSVVARLARSWSETDPEAVPTSAANMLSAAVLKTDFDIARGDVDDLVGAQGEVLFEGANDLNERTTAIDGVKRIRRLFNVSTDPAILERLVLKRINGTLPLRGAIDVARYGKGAFMAQFPEANADEMRALSYVHDRARGVADTVANLVVGQHQDHRDVIPAAAAGSLAALSGEPSNDVQDGVAIAQPAGAATETPIAAWSDLFGATEVCECDDCRSVIGPAAYLVDLFEFLDKRCAPDPTNQVTPLDVLIGHPTKSFQPGGPPGITGMRPDLAHIKLSCENTNTTIPTIDLINEILESVIASGSDAPALPNESSPGVTGPELSAAPEHVVAAAYDKVGNAIYPVSLPYERLVVTARVYLKQAGTSRAELIRLLSDAPTSQREGAEIAETLGLFRRDYEILTFKTLAGEPLATPIEVADLFGFAGAADASWMTVVAGSRNLLAALELTFTELIDLIRTRFIGGEVPTGNPGELASRLFLSVDQLKTVREADYVVQPGSEIERALTLGGLTAAELRSYIEARNPRLASTIVLDPPGGCSPDEIGLRHLDASHLTDEAEWLAMHRFVRLARRMKIGVGDLDVALFALTASAQPGFAPELLAGLAVLRNVKDQFGLDWPVVASLIADIGTHGSTSLYDTLFPPRGFARVHPEFRRGPAGEVLAADRDITAGLPGLAVAFGLNADSLAKLAKTLGVAKLDLAGVSAIHRAIVLSRALGVAPEEIVVFSRSISGPDLAGPVIAPEALARLMMTGRDYFSAGLSSATVACLTGQQPAGTNGVGTSPQALKKFVADLAAQRKGFAEQEAREQAEEAERAEAQRPFTAEEIAARRSAAEQRRRATVLSQFASGFGLEPAIIGRLLDDAAAGEALLRHDGKPAVALFMLELSTPELEEAAFRLLDGIDRLAVLVKAAKFDAPAFALATGEAAIVTVDAISGLMDQPTGTTVATMLTDLVAFVTLLRDTGRPSAMAKAISALAQSGWSDATFAAIGSWLDRPAAAVAAVPRAGGAELDEATAKGHPVPALGALRKRLAVLRRIGAQAPDAVSLTKEPIPLAAIDKLAQGVSSGYARADWLDVSRQLSDPIREASRDALTTFLLQREKLQTAEQLFDRFYIDPGTNSFVLTSRIRQAIFAVQIFVQRCLMGFERIHGVHPDQIDKEEWRTISRHPVWAARGKGMLFAEELLTPSWRDNKSPAFKSFEAALQQGDITPTNAEVAYRTYLDQFEAVASLEVCGTYLQEVFEGRERLYFRSVLHVVGRTRGGAARKYFYRRLNRYEHHEEWTSWEPVEVDIQAIEPDRQEAKSDGSPPLREAGVHLLPVVWRGQVYLFWPMFMHKVDQPNKETNAPKAKDGAATPRYSEPYWEIKLCWTRKDGPSWTPKEQSSALFETWWYENDEKPPEWDDEGTVDYLGYAGTNAPQYPDPSRVTLKASIRDDSLSIVVSTREGPWGPKPRGTFSFSRAASEMKFSVDGGGPYGDHLRAIGSSGASPSFMGFKAKGEISFVASHKKPEGDVLFTAPDEARFTTLNQFYGSPLSAPFFIDLKDRSYLARSSPGVSTTSEKVQDPATTPGSPEWAKPFDRNFVSVVTAKAERETNPWVKAAVWSNMPYLGAMTESAKAEDVSVGQTAVIAKLTPDFHRYVGPIFRTVEVPGVKLDVKPFFHPFADRFTEVLRRDGLAALLTPQMQQQQLLPSETFAGLTKPAPDRVTTPAVEGMDFEQSTPYGNYNWEIFFHAPVMLAQKLFDNGQYDAAIDIIHQAVYTPFAANPQECWRFEGLRGVAPMRLDAMLALLSRPDSDPEKENMLAQIDTMRHYPFQAHRIARLRPLAYKKWVVAFDVRAHLAMGDKHFRRFTPEDVNLAIQYYMIAYREMGTRPELMLQRATMPARSYAELRPDLDAMGNVMFEAEAKLAGVPGSVVAGSDGAATSLMRRGAIGYFGIPKNEKLLALWDEVADRLFKIRNGMNIDGVQMQLPLFSPAIDPALLAEAIASGLDIEAVLEQLAQPLPKHRYAFIHRRAMEHAEAVVRLGDALLAVREKRDNEVLIRTRARHATEMADLIAQTRQRQLEEAEADRDVVSHEEDAGKQRWMHFAKLLGELPENALFFAPYQTVPARKLTLVPADRISFESLRVIPDIAKVGGFLAGGAPGLALAVADEGAGGIRGLGAGQILQEEQQELESSFEAVKTTFDAAMLDTIASLLGVIPNFEAAVKPFGAGAAVHLGGQFFAAAASAKARNKRAAADMQNFVASVYRKQADLILRERGWVLEMNEAALGVLQARRKKAVADIRFDIAQKAVATQKKDVEDARAIESFLDEKFSNAELYDWTERRLRQLFKQCFSLALESARMAEACYEFERERPASPFIRMSMPANARDELLAGHELMARLRDMDRAYITVPRPGELTRHISLSQIDPHALNELRERGETTFKVPEVLFDIDHPGYYDRRIWSVQVTIPCIAGSNTPVTGTLTLASSERRKKPKLNVAPEPDPQTGASIALSSCRGDSGLFELSSQDPLYRPFEGMGAVSTWTLSLPKVLRSFDYWSISDVVLTMQLTAKRGSDAFRDEVSAGLKKALDGLTTVGGNVGVYQVVSVRHELPDSWHRFTANQGLSVTLTTELLSFMLRELNPKLKEVAGKVRMAGETPSQVLRFKAPEGQGPRWTLEVEDDSPEVLRTPDTVVDITLFARYELPA